MPKRARFKPSVPAICVLGTLAHNRAFTTREIVEYTRWDRPGIARTAAQTMRWMRRLKLVRPGDRKGTWYPTGKGWNMIEKACRR